MRSALTAFVCVASLSVIATAASAQTIPHKTGAALYSYHNTGPMPGAVGSCEIIAGNRVCSAGPGEMGYGYPMGGPVGAIVGAPFAIVAAPFGAMGGQPVAPVAPYGEATYAPATGAAPYSYESQIGPQPGAIGHCDLISGNRICQSTP